MMFPKSHKADRAWAWHWSGLRAGWRVMRVAVILAVLSLPSGCTRLEPPVEGKPKVLPDLELYGAEVRYSRDGLPRFTVRAGRIIRMETQAMVLLNDSVRVDFFDAQGRHNARLTADEGEVLEREDKLAARGGVVVRSDSGLVLRTEELYYDQKLERVLSDAFVTVITPDDSLSGYGFDADPSLRDWIIKNTSGTTMRRVTE